MIHIYREGNTIFDILDNEVIMSKIRLLISRDEELPVEAKGAMRIERLGLPYIKWWGQQNYTIVNKN